MLIRHGGGNWRRTYFLSEIWTSIEALTPHPGKKSLHLRSYAHASTRTHEHTYTHTHARTQFLLNLPSILLTGTVRTLRNKTIQGKICSLKCGLGLRDEETTDISGYKICWYSLIQKQWKDASVQHLKIMIINWSMWCTRSLWLFHKQVWVLLCLLFFRMKQYCRTSHVLVGESFHCHATTEHLSAKVVE